MMQLLLQLISILHLFMLPFTSALTSHDYKVNFHDRFNIADDLYAGFMPIKLEPKVNNEGNFFFWLAMQRNRDINNYSTTGSATKRKLVVWLNGGPGCSSMVGMMWENGPFTLHDKYNSDGSVNGDYELRNNPYSWNEIADVLYVEQPLRTGFSTAATGARVIRTGEEVGQDFYSFLKSFLSVFDELKDAHVYITGESYAGFYIPWIASHIVHHQLDMNPSDPTYIDIQGVAIGNGALDDAIQEASYAEYAYTHGLIPLGAKLQIDDIYNRCIENSAGHVKTSPDSTESSTCESMSLVLAAAGNPNEYNTATFIGYDHIITADGPFHRFFNDPVIQELIHVRGYDIPGINFSPEPSSSSPSSTPSSSSSSYYVPKSWEVCNDDINDDMRGGHPLSCVPAIQFLINHIQVLLYSGEQDLNTNFLGTLHVLQAHVWYDKRFSSASRSLWKHGDDVAGTYHALDKLAFLIVRNSGHLLPMDLPAIALDMINRFLYDMPFNDVNLPSESEYYHQLLSSPSSSSSSSTSSSSSYVMMMVMIGLMMMLVIGYYMYIHHKHDTSSSSSSSTRYYPVSMIMPSHEMRSSSIQMQHTHQHHPHHHKAVDHAGMNGYQSL